MITIGTPTDQTVSQAAAVELVGVRKEYSVDGVAVEAVRTTDLRIRTGEFFSLLGPSGCGKTTILRMIGGFVEATEGAVLLHGKDVTKLSPDKRDVNMVFQSYALFPHLNVAKNIEFGLSKRELSAKERRNKVAEALELVSLSGYAHRMPSELSGGQQQRVALARALVRDPSVLLLDEPLAALDMKLRQSMQVELMRIHKEVGITFIFVTHDQNEAMTMSDRIAVMEGGQIRQLAEPQELYERPNSEFVAGFIGASNILSGKVVSVQNGVAELESREGDRVLVGCDSEVHSGIEVKYVLRPESAELTETIEQPESSALSCVVKSMIYQGSTSVYIVETSSGEVSVSTPNRGRPTWQPGDRAFVTWHHSNVYTLPTHNSREEVTSG